MVLSVLSILRAYHPEFDAEEQERQTTAYFKDALTRLSVDLREGADIDESSELYKRNIAHRLRTL